ncbi:hypothetical protein CABS03_11146 [Colletotrichum abscissum]|uniref:Uncharacterized protein n=1 Tax=Colletotrichum abscissum TaxID=1671311 RepID=A0A9Q0B4N0_9PEZI|nr:hypothetical protein CABS02_06629 [Colletotrichum abscissum]
MPIRSSYSPRQQTDETHDHESQSHRKHRQLSRLDSSQSHPPTAQRVPARSRALHRLAPACFPSFRLTKFAYLSHSQVVATCHNLCLSTAYFLALWLSHCLSCSRFGSVRSCSRSCLLVFNRHHLFQTPSWTQARGGSSRNGSRLRPALKYMARYALPLHHSTCWRRAVLKLPGHVGSSSSHR